MSQSIYQQPDPKIIETLKAARNQVVQADKSEGENTNVIDSGQNPSPKQARNKFAEEFIQKLTSIEKEIAEIDEEMAKLKARKNELTKVEDKLKELDKEMGDVLKFQ